MNLTDEIRLLYKVEAWFKIPAAPVVRRLIMEADRPLPDLLPPKPPFVTFQWPESGAVDYRSEWDRADKSTNTAGRL